MYRGSPSPVRQLRNNSSDGQSADETASFSSSITAKLASAQYPLPGASFAAPSPLPIRQAQRGDGMRSASRVQSTGINITTALPLFNEQNEKVFLTQCWVIAKQWLLAGRAVRRASMLLLLLLMGLTAFILLDSFQSSGTPVSVTSEFPDVSDPDAAVLNLHTGFAPTSAPLIDDDEPDLSWGANRQYGIVIDAGSSGSRVQVYSWINPMHVRQVMGLDDAKNMLPTIEKGDEKGDNWQMKEEPGISSFASKPDEIGVHLKPLLEFAKNVIPSSKHASTPIYLLATAGMRLVSEDARVAVMRETCRYVKEYYPFAVHGGCSRHFRVISGELEGIYGWITVNYLKNGFNIHNDADKNTTNAKVKHTFGFLDMGGASTQIAFEPTADMALRHSDDLTKLKLRFLGGKELTYRVFVTTFLGFGVNEARRRHLEALMTEYKKHNGDTLTLPSSPSNATDAVETEAGKSIAIPEPCLPLGLQLPTSTIPPISYNGTGEFQTCLSTLLPLLNKSLPCPELPCLFNGVHAPISDALHFLGVSEYWYTSSDVYGLGGAYNHSLFLSSTEKFCAQSWAEITHLHELKKWPSVHDLDRLTLQCFKSAWILNVLHEGLGVPRDHVRVPGDEDDNGRAVGVVGEGASSDSVFESVNEIGTFGVSWTLGAMLLHIVATIPVSSQPAATTPSGISFIPALLTFLLLLLVVAAVCLWYRRNAGAVKYSGLRQGISSQDTALLDISVRS
ncbi:nucleoside phosphatase family-domain-containing protein [Powellomyces hirtus]|nr:nucleoside phosphatase family-domain-containing protein [Powellomyces hirtus]